MDLSVHDYEKSVLLATFVTRIKDDIIVSPSITDASFKPMINGYEITFKEKGIYVKLELKVTEDLFKRKKLVVYVFDADGTVEKIKTHNIDEGIKAIESILVRIKESA